jgi:hypothetical protein
MYTTYFGCSGLPKQVGDVFDTSEHTQLLSDVHAPLLLHTAEFDDNRP